MSGGEGLGATAWNGVMMRVPCGGELSPVITRPELWLFVCAGEACGSAGEYAS